MIEIELTKLLMIKSMYISDWCSISYQKNNSVSVCTHKTTCTKPRGKDFNIYMHTYF